MRVTRARIWTVIALLFLVWVVASMWLRHSRRAQYELRNIDGVTCVVEKVTRSLSCDWSNDRTGNL